MIRSRFLMRHLNILGRPVGHFCRRFSSVAVGAAIRQAQMVGYLSRPEEPLLLVKTAGCGLGQIRSVAAQQPQVSGQCRIPFRLARVLGGDG